MKLLILLFLGACTSNTISSNTEGVEKESLSLAKNLLESVRYKKNYTVIQSDLADLNFDFLHKSLDSDEKKLAFWINIYNAYVQLLLREHPELFEDRGAFFSESRITIAGLKLSFDDIEHGIIRRSQNKLSLGLIPKLFTPKYERKLRTDERDGRVHFALNCGAKSCPPVAIYEAERIHEQLDKSSKHFLEVSTTYKEEENKAYVTSLFSWFRGDFGGLDGVREYLVRYGLVEEGTDPSLSFTTYDWTMDLGNYVDL